LAIRSFKKGQIPKNYKGQIKAKFSSNIAKITRILQNIASFAQISPFSKRPKNGQIIYFWQTISKKAN